MSDVLIRCPNCGTTQAALGECDACREAQVRYFCTNHDPGRWLDGPACPACGARYGMERGAGRPGLPGRSGRPAAQPEPPPSWRPPRGRNAFPSTPGLVRCVRPNSEKWWRSRAGRSGHGGGIRSSCHSRRTPLGWLLRVGVYPATDHPLRDPVRTDGTGGVQTARNWNPAALSRPIGSRGFGKALAGAETASYHRGYAPGRSHQPQSRRMEIP